MFHLNGTHGAVYIESKTFSDGQPHIHIPHIREIPNNVTITGRLTSADDLLKLQLIVDVLRFNDKNDISLQLSYLMGGRMDREISSTHPSTLKVICNTINSLNFKHIFLYDCHSVVSQTLLRAENVLPLDIVANVTQNYYTGRGITPIIVIPDAGATSRVSKLVNGQNLKTVQGLKVRNSTTQDLSDFKIFFNGFDIYNKSCLIIDDICDGGRTFSNIAHILKTEYQVKYIDLFVTHGIFSYGSQIKDINRVFTTNSYRDMTTYDKSITVFECPFAPIPEPTTITNLKENYK